MPEGGLLQESLLKMEKIVISPQFTKDGVSVRFASSWTRQLLNNWNAWNILDAKSPIRQILEDWDNWKLKKSEFPLKLKDVEILRDNGLKGDGVCPFHNYQHTHIFPLNAQPPTCHEAVMFLQEQQREKENARF